MSNRLQKEFEGDGKDDLPLEARLKKLRDQIDELDEHLVRLLNDRANCALALGRLKEEEGLDTYQPDREKEVLSHALSVNSGPLGGDAISRLFENIINENRQLEQLAENKD